MNIHTVTRHDSTRRVLDLEVEHLAWCEAELLARVADLENERNTYRELAVVALENVARLTQRNRQLADRIDGLNRELRGILESERAA